MMQNLWKQVAGQYHVSAAEVQAEISAAISQGMCDPDPSVQQAWKEVPSSDEIPNPEEVVAWIAAQLLGAGLLPNADAVSECPEYAVKR